MFSSLLLCRCIQGCIRKLSSFNKSFSTEVSIDDAINPYSEPTKELVISSHKNMNNDNNSNSVENNITECDVDTAVIIVDDSNKINVLKKERKKIKQGKQWLIKISKKFLSWETVL